MFYIIFGKHGNNLFSSMHNTTQVLAGRICPQFVPICIYNLDVDEGGDGSSMHEQAYKLMDQHIMYHQ
jgi:hypothetical protein